MDSIGGDTRGTVDAGLEPDPPWWQRRKWRAFGAVGLSYTTIVIAMSMSFLVLPAIAESFEVTLRAVGWVVIVEALVIAALLLPIGGFSDTIGRRRVLLGGLIVFGAGSVFTGLAPGFAALICARIVMSIGNAMVQSVGTGIIVASFPPAERGLAIGAQSTAVAIGGAAGPLLGGLLLEVLPWEVLFFIMGVPAALSAIAVLVFIPDDTVRRSHATTPFDHTGGLLSALTVIVLVLTVSNPFGQSAGSPIIVTGIVATIALGTAFVRWELRQRAPMFELRLFAVSEFRLAALSRVLGFIGATVTTFLLPVYLLTVRGLGEGAAGALIFLVAVGMGTSAQLAGRLYDRIGPRPPTVAGLALQALTAIALATADETTSVALLAPVILLTGFALGLWIVPNNSAMLGAMPADALGVGGAFTNVTRTIGNVLGQAVAAAVVAGVMASRGFDIPLGDIADTTGAPGAFIAGWQAAYWGVAVLGAATMVLATRLPGR